MWLLYPYKKGSQSATALARALGIKKVKTENSRLKGSRRKTVINWGANELPAEVLKCNVINPPKAVKMATNKLNFFNILKEEEDVSIPEFTTDINVAKGWAEEDSKVVCRTLLNSSAGKGIVLASTPDEVVQAPLYTKYIKKLSEFRVHIFKGGVLDVQKKAKAHDVPKEEANWEIRTHANGFIYMREDIDVPECVINNALKAVEATGLDFGAVDVIYNQHYKNAYVLEVNTAPGLTGQTLTNYEEAFKELRNGH